MKDKYNINDKIESIIKDNDLIYTKDIVAEGITKPSFYEYTKNNNYIQVSRGVYSKDNVIVDRQLIIQNRCPNAIFSHDESLYYYGLIDREPIRNTITIYTGYRTKNLVKDNVKVYTVKKELLNIGKITVTNNFGNNINIYNLERTICDLFRSRNNFETQDFSTAIKRYINRKDKDLNKLMKYAKSFKVDKIMKKYLEILL